MLVGVDALKSQLFARLGRGASIRFSLDLEPVFFEQLASERRIIRYVRGAPVRRFERIPRKKAETLDAMIYAIAPMSLIISSFSNKSDKIFAEGLISIKNLWLND